MVRAMDRYVIKTIERYAEWKSAAKAVPYWGGDGVTLSYLIARNDGRENGWVSSTAVFGKCVRVET